MATTKAKVYSFQDDKKTILDNDIDIVVEKRKMNE